MQTNKRCCDWLQCVQLLLCAALWKLQLSGLLLGRLSPNCSPNWDKSPFQPSWMSHWSMFITHYWQNKQADGQCLACSHTRSSWPGWGVPEVSAHPPTAFRALCTVPLPCRCLWTESQTALPAQISRAQHSLQCSYCSARIRAPASSHRPSSQERGVTRDHQDGIYSAGSGLKKKRGRRGRITKRLSYFALTFAKQNISIFCVKMKLWLFK